MDTDSGVRPADSAVLKASLKAGSISAEQHFNTPFLSLSALTQSGGHHKQPLSVAPAIHSITLFINDIRLSCS